MEKARSAELGWAVLIGGIALYDLTAPETLSSGFRRGLEAHRGLVIGAWALTSAHLFGLIPEQYDPFKFLCNQKDSRELGA